MNKTVNSKFNLLNLIKNIYFSYPDRFFILIVVFFILLIYGQNIYHSTLLNYDDPILVNVLSDVHSLNDYLKLIDQKLILDLQPLRDLSYLIDWNLFRITGHRTFHLTNVLIWIFISISFFLILKTLKLNNWKFLTLYAITHPVAIQSVAWISGRKHLLSTFFILLCCLMLLKLKNNPQNKLFNIYFLNSVAFYILSLLSQPMPILVPLLVLVFIFIEDFKRISFFHTQAFKMLGIFLLIAILGSYLNWKYYLSDSYIYSFISPKTWVEGNNVPTKLLLLGRFFIQLFFPLIPGLVSYTPANIMNLIGLLILPLFIWIGKKLFSFRFVFLHFLLILATLAPITLVMTNTFGMDTYLLFSLFIWVLLYGRILIQIFEKVTTILSFEVKKISFILAGIFITGQTAWSVYNASFWTNNEKFFTEAIKRENDSLSEQYYALWAISEHKYDIAFEAGSRLYQKKFLLNITSMIIGYSLLNIETLPWDKKLQIIDQHACDCPNYLFYRSLILIQLDQWEEAAGNFLKILKNLNDSQLLALRLPKDLLIKNAKFICEKNLKACPELMPFFNENVSK